MNFLKSNKVGLFMIFAGAAFLGLGLVDNWLWGSLFDFSATFAGFRVSAWVGIAGLCRFLLFVWACGLVVLGVLYVFKVFKTARLAKIWFVITLATIMTMMLSTIVTTGAWAMLVANICVVISALVVLKSRSV